MRTGTTGIIFLFGEQCFIEVARVPLLYRILLSGQKVGIQKWVILAWYEAARVYARLAAEAKLKDICWRVHDMQDADSASLTEVLPDEETLVIPCTAVFDHRVLLALQESKQAALCVRTTKPAMDADTTEGLLVQNGQVIDEAPTTHTTYLTTGILRCPGKLLRRAMFETWEVMQSASDPLKSVLSGLMAGTTLKALDVDQYLWVPLTPPFKTSVATAEIQLLRSLGREGDSPVCSLAAPEA